MRALVLAAVLVGAANEAITPAATQSSTSGIRVWVFTTTECPIANRYVPEIKRLADQFSPRGVKFTMVYPVPSDSDAMVREHLAKYQIDLAFTRDPGFAMVKLTGVTVAPEVAVLDELNRVLYRGRVDDRIVDFGKERPAPTSRDLEGALSAIVAGQPVPVAKTRAVGCFLADLLK
jgi:Redoxin